MVQTYNHKYILILDLIFEVISHVHVKKIQGGKTEHSAAFGTTNTGLRVAITTAVRGLSKITTDKKKEIFEATREK